MLYTLRLTRVAGVVDVAYVVTRVAAVVRVVHVVPEARSHKNSGGLLLLVVAVAVMSVTIVAEVVTFTGTVITGGGTLTVSR